MAWPDTIKGAAASIGITGTLIGIGYTLNTGSEDFLGYQLRDSSTVAANVAAAGEYLYAIPSSFVQWTVATGPHLVAAAFTIIVVILLFRYGSRFTAPRLLIGLLCLVTVSKFIYFDVPTFYLGDMLVDLGQNRAAQASGIVGSRVNQIRTDHICSRRPVTPPDSIAPARIDSVLNVRCGLGGRASFTQRLTDAFVLNAAITFFLLGGVIILVQDLVSAEPSIPAGARSLAGVLAAFIILDVAIAPYQYAKTTRPTLAHRTKIIADSATVREINGYLLAGRSGDLTVYAEAAREIWIIPKSQVKLVHLGERSDVLAVHLEKRVEDITAHEVKPP